MTSTKFVVEEIKKFNPKAIILFGSAARGEAREDSDLDLLVVMDSDRPIGIRSGELRAQIRTNMPLDIIVLTPKEAGELPKKSTFFSQIVKEGKLLYGRI
jgi:predicted nucleotidyltransferase